MCVVDGFSGPLIVQPQLGQRQQSSSSAAAHMLLCWILELTKLRIKTNHSAEETLRKLASVTMQRWKYTEFWNKYYRHWCMGWNKYISIIYSNLHSLCWMVGLRNLVILPRLITPIKQYCWLRIEVDLIQKFVYINFQSSQEWQILSSELATT